MAYMHVFLLYTINYNLYVYYLFSDVWALYPRWGQERFFGPFRSNSMGCGRTCRIRWGPEMFLGPFQIKFHGVRAGRSGGRAHI